MKIYIALLRGINVSGQKVIKMNDLRSIMEELGFSEVETYLQSGNIVFKTEKSDQYKLKNLIKGKISDTFRFEVEVIILSSQELKEIYDNNPFLKHTDKDPERFYVTFLSEKPSAEQVEKLKTYDYKPEEYHLIKTRIYFYAPNGYGRAKMNNNFFENRLKVFATTRNWKTVNNLVNITTANTITYREFN